MRLLVHIKSNKIGSDQKQEMFLDILCLFLVNYRFSQHLTLITTPNPKLS